MTMTQVQQLRLFCRPRHRRLHLVPGKTNCDNVIRNKNCQSKQTYKVDRKSENEIEKKYIVNQTRQRRPALVYLRLLLTSHVQPAITHGSTIKTLYTTYGRIAESQPKTP